MEKCVDRCEFQQFDGSKFYCILYENILTTDINNNVIEVSKCKKCIDEGYIGSETKDEFIRKMKQHLGWLMDSFYSLKDDMEEEITHIYRILKELDEDETINFSKDNNNRKRE